MSNASISSAARTNLRSLQDISAQIGAVQKRLSTGKKVSSAFDNPASFFAASALNARASGLNAVIDKIGTAQKTLEAAKTAVSSLQDLLDNAKSLANQALSSPDTLAKFLGTVSGLTGASNTGLANGKTITVSDGTTTATFTMSGSRKVQDILDAVNTQAGLNVGASLVDGKIQFKAKGVNSVIIGGTATTAELASTGLVAGTTFSTTNATRQSLAQQYDNVRKQIDDLVKDASFNGTNLLSGNSLEVTFDEAGSSKMTIAGLNVSATGLGISAVTTGTGINFQSDTEINTALTQIDAGTDLVEAYSTVFASYASSVGTRKDFTTALIDILQSGADELTLADTNTDGAELLALQTRQQIAMTSLSLTSQGDQTVLRLFS